MRLLRATDVCSLTALVARNLKSLFLDWTHSFKKTMLPPEAFTSSTFSRLLSFPYWGSFIGHIAFSSSMCQIGLCLFCRRKCITVFMACTDNMRLSLHLNVHNSNAFTKSIFCHITHWWYCVCVCLCLCLCALTHSVVSDS